MKRFLCIFISLCFLYTAAMAECGTKEEAIAILQCNKPYMHTVPDKAMEAWEKGNADAFSFMDVTEEERKNGIDKWSAAVQMFQKLYFPDDPFFSDTLEGHCLLDAFMAEANLIPHIYHIMPTPDEIDRDEAWNLALDGMKKKYNLNFSGLTRNMKVDTHYFTPTGEWKDAFWLFHVDLEDGAQYAIQVKDGHVIVCQRLERQEALFEAYMKLCDEKDAFFTWSLDNKVNYATQLPDAILEAYMEGQDLGRCGDLLAIARQGFSLPSNGVIGQAEALDKAGQAVENTFSPPEGWDHRAKINYSLYRQGDMFIWRVIFWNTGLQELPGAVVDMDANTGIPCRVERYDGTPESIPYVERL